MTNDYGSYRAAESSSHQKYPYSCLHKAPKQQTRRAYPLPRDMVESEAWNDFKRRDTRYLEPELNPDSELDVREDVTSILTAHARLLVFADEYGIGMLSKLCSQNIHQTLVDFELYEDRVLDIVGLLRYAYSNPRSEGLKGGFVHFAGFLVRQLSVDENFRALLEEGGPFPGDFISHILS